MKLPVLFCSPVFGVVVIFVVLGLLVELVCSVWLRDSRVSVVLVVVPVVISGPVDVVVVVVETVLLLLVGLVVVDVMELALELLTDELFTT